MNLPLIAHQFADDKQLRAVVVLIAADIILGVLASIVNPGQGFRLTYVANFMRNDVIGKVLPWFVVFTFGKVSSASVLGVDFGSIADGTWFVVSAALVGSLVKSLGDLGVPVPAALGGAAP